MKFLGGVNIGEFKIKINEKRLVYGIKRNKEMLKKLYKTKREEYPNLKKLLNHRNIMHQKKLNKEKQKKKQMEEKAKAMKIAEKKKIQNEIDAFDNHSIHDSSEDSDGFL